MPDAVISIEINFTWINYTGHHLRIQAADASTDLYRTGTPNRGMPLALINNVHITALELARKALKSLL